MLLLLLLLWLWLPACPLAAVLLLPPLLLLPLRLCPLLLLLLPRLLLPRPLPARRRPSLLLLRLHPARLLFPKLHPARPLLPLPPESEHSHRLLEILQKASALVFRCRGFFLFSGFYLIPARHGSGQGLPQNGSLPAAGPRKVPCRSSRSARLSGCRSSR